MAVVCVVGVETRGEGVEVVVVPMRGKENMGLDFCTHSRERKQ